MVEPQRSAALNCDEMSAWTSKIRPGGWYELWSFALGGSSVALGIRFMEPSCKVNMHKGFIEFNPNKVAGDKRFHGLLKTLGTCVKARLKRFDLAYDIPVSRYDCRLSRTGACTSPSYRMASRSIWGQEHARIRQGLRQGRRAAS